MSFYWSRLIFNGAAQLYFIFQRLYYTLKRPGNAEKCIIEM